MPETHSETTPSQPSNLAIALGILAFLSCQYAYALYRLAYLASDKSMSNKFSAVARDQYLSFLIGQNLLMLIAYAIVGIASFLLIRPAFGFYATSKFPQSRWATMTVAFIAAAFLHYASTLHLISSRPYFINPNETTAWYYQWINLPQAIKPTAWFVLFKLLPLAWSGFCLLWYFRRCSLRLRWGLAATCLIAIGSCFWVQQKSTPISNDSSSALNVIILGSDSLRSDHLGCNGYRPKFSNDPKNLGVSPRIDALAQESVRFENCYTSIASTLESGVQLMSSQYPQSHGIRQMYPSHATVEATKNRIVPIAGLLRRKGYDTAAIGDWCASYYGVLPMDFETISTSSFDNFQIYMSQAVVLAHFIVPLHFDNAFGYHIFPQLQSFAQFVVPSVVTDRVSQRIQQVAKSKQPFFWHVFFSCNHLPYRSNEPYVSMFTNPRYQGKHKTGVDFDINSFIGGTDLESKWKALPPEDIEQIRGLYDGCTRQFDDCVGKILDDLKRTGLDKNTILIITADHGDDLYEPGVTLGHGLTFNGALHANHPPMIVKVPGAKPNTIPHTVRLIDVIPTIADFLNVSPSPSWQGKSFAGWIRGNTTPEYRPFYGETGFPFIQFSVKGIERPKLPPMDELTFIDEDYNFHFVLKPEYESPLIKAKQRCLRTQHWKLVCTPTANGSRHFGLFHLTTDPYGERDLAPTQPAILQPMKAALERWMDEKYESSIPEIFPNGEPSPAISP